MTMLLTQDGKNAYNMDFIKQIYVDKTYIVAIDAYNVFTVGKYKNNEEAETAFEDLLDMIYRDCESIIEVPKQYNRYVIAVKCVEPIDGRRYFVYSITAHDKEDASCIVSRATCGCEIIRVVECGTAEEAETVKAEWEKVFA